MQQHTAGPERGARASTPSRIGRYQIIRSVGRGAYGRVYACHDPVLDREVAVKVISAGLPEDVRDEMLQRFQSEARISGRLNHPGVVAVYDAGLEGEMPFVAMELCSGPSLEYLLRLHGRLPTGQAVWAVRQLADALDYVHSHGIIHRDIKPANILMHDGRLKITDFGIARSAAMSRVTTAGQVVGSPAYMSPEQARGEELDYRSDLYALGAVLFEMLAGRVPFVGEPLKVMSELCTRGAPLLSTLVPEVSRPLELIVARSMAMEPEERYPNGTAMCRELRRVVPPELLVPIGSGPDARATVSMPELEGGTVDARDPALNASGTLPPGRSSGVKAQRAGRGPGSAAGAKAPGQASPMSIADVLSRAMGSGEQVAPGHDPGWGAGAAGMPMNGPSGNASSWSGSATPAAGGAYPGGPGTRSAASGGVGGSRPAGLPPGFVADPSYYDDQDEVDEDHEDSFPEGGLQLDLAAVSASTPVTAPAPGAATPAASTPAGMPPGFVAEPAKEAPPPQTTPPGFIADRPVVSVSATLPDGLEGGADVTSLIAGLSVAAAGGPGATAVVGSVPGMPVPVAGSTTQIADAVASLFGSGTTGQVAEAGRPVAGLTSLLAGMSAAAGGPGATAAMVDAQPRPGPAAPAAAMPGVMPVPVGAAGGLPGLDALVQMPPTLSAVMAEKPVSVRALPTPMPPMRTLSPALGTAQLGPLPHPVLPTPGQPPGVSSPAPAPGSAVASGAQSAIPDCPWDEAATPAAPARIPIESDPSLRSGIGGRPSLAMLRALGRNGPRPGRVAIFVVFLLCGVGTFRVATLPEQLEGDAPQAETEGAAAGGATGGIASAAPVAPAGRRTVPTGQGRPGAVSSGRVGSTHPGVVALGGTAAGFRTDDPGSMGGTTGSSLSADLPGGSADAPGSGSSTAGDPSPAKTASGGAHPGPGASRPVPLPPPIPLPDGVTLRLHHPSVVVAGQTVSLEVRVQPALPAGFTVAAYWNRSDRWVPGLVRARGDGVYVLELVPRAGALQYRFELVDRRGVPTAEAHDRLEVRAAGTASAAPVVTDNAAARKN